MPESLLNKGLLVSPWINPQANHFGAVTSLLPEILRADRNWTQYLGIYEPQSFCWGDSQACVSYSALNCVEILTKFRTGQEQNYSDRFLAKESGTTSMGNYLEKVADTIALIGLVPETLWPAQAISQTDYYKSIPPEIENESQKFLESFDFGWQWVGASRTTILMALKTSPLQVTVKVGSPINDKGYYIDGGSTSYGHAVTMYNATDEYYEIFDHYENKFKKYDASYPFGHAIAFYLKLKTMPFSNPLNLTDNSLIQLVESGGNFGLFLDGKIIIDDTAKILASFIVRNSGDTKDKIRAVTLAQWQLYPHINLKGEPV